MSSCENVTALMPAPEGYVVDFCNPQRAADVATYWCFGLGMVLSVLFTAQRVYVKLVIGTGWQVDDSILALAWVASLATQILIVYGFASGFIGIHVWEVSIPKFNDFLLDLYVSAPTYIFAGSCAKIALSIFYLRLSPQRWFRYSIFATILFIAGYSLGIFFSLIFSCMPIAKSFDTSVTTGSCISTASLYIATAVFNIMSDIILFILPIPMVVGLQMKWRAKVGLLVIFGIGSVTIVTSIMRAVVLPALLTSTDTSWDVAYASMLVVVEANLIIICGMLPTLRKFCRHVAPKIIGENSYGHSNRSGGLGGGGISNKNKFSNSSPPIVTFGSAPSQKGGHRGYAKFDRGGQEEYAFALETIGGTPTNLVRAHDYHQNQYQHEDHSPLGSMVGGISRSGSSKVRGTVDTIVTACDDDADEIYDRMSGRSSGGGGGGRNSLGSRDSQLPITGGAGVGGPSPSGIKATTRIEVSYDTIGTVL